MIGKTLGHYQITGQLGKGGMGEVFQAKDQKLGRDVAIKVLPEEFAKDADRVARFQREAKVLASLNHPNIAAIYGLEESGGTNFLVLELVEGEMLADRIAGKDAAGKAALPGILKIALQIAEALEAAHEKGIIHRDLKPANIKVTPDGKVKVLDFGLAKAYAGDKEEVNLSNSPTLSNAATRQGVILGTAAYMSPEQARGEPVDKKADIWAFGVVLFEMLTGRGMFEGRTVSDTLAAVLMREPEWKRLPPNLHPRIRLLLERCLEKEPRNRCSGIGDARADIQKALAEPAGVYVQSATAAESRTRLHTIIPWFAAAVVIIAIIAGLAFWKWKQQEPPRVMRFEYELPEGQQFGDLSARALAISPDGQRIVYTTPDGLYQRPINEFKAKPISGTQGNPGEPFFSPDGKWIGYVSYTEGKLKKIGIGGGAPVALTDTRDYGSFTWGEDDTIFYGLASGGIVRISANGGTPQVILKPKAALAQCPQLLPDGKSVLYESHPGGRKVIVQSLGSNEPKELFPGSGARYVQTGHILYTSENNLLAVPFDPDKLEVSGGAVPVVEGIYQTDLPQYAVSDSGTLVYIPAKTGAAAAARTLVWVDRKGKEEPLGTAPNVYYAPKISPDGTRVSLTVGDYPNEDIRIWDLARKNLIRLTFGEGSNSGQLWSPDSKRFVFTCSDEAKPGICIKAADGTGKTDRLYSGLSYIGCLSWSSEAKALVCEEMTPGGFVDIVSLSLESSPARKPLLHEKWIEASPQISPDGRWMAYGSDESGPSEIYVRPFPDVESGGRWQVSTSGGLEPRWSHDGRELFYRNGDAMMAVTVETDPAFKAGVPKQLFAGKYFFETGHMWDISPDGKRFLMIKEPASADSASKGPRTINIVLNWFEELKQLVPKK